MKDQLLSCARAAAGFAVVLALLIVGVPAFGHNGVRLSGFGTATIDGVAAPGEWDHAGCTSFTVNLPQGGTSPGSICAMNNTRNLYLKISYSNPDDGLGGTVMIQFDNHNAGGSNLVSGDYLVVNYGLWSGLEFVDLSISPACPNGCRDTQAGGSNDGNAAYTHNSDAVSTYEISHPLSSGDPNDFVVGPADTVGFTSMIMLFSATNAWAQSYYPTGNYGVPEMFADIGIASEPCSAPQLSSVAVTPALLWPVDHKMKDVMVTYEATSNCSTTCGLAVASNELSQCTADGNTLTDWSVIDAHHVQLRAERTATDKDRVYTIGVSCSNAAGTARQSAIVTVPHDSHP